MTGEPDRTIFISYSHRDTDIVARLRTDLQAVGLHIWIDHEDIGPGTSNWEKAIRAAIEDSTAVIYVASEAAYASDHCQGELAAARAFNRRIYPVFVKGEDFVKCIPMELNHAQYVDLRGDRYAVELPRLLMALGIQQAANVTPVLPAEPKKSAVASDFVPKNPYKGLYPFTAEDRPYFFGRTTLVQTLSAAVETADKERFLAVVGPSGAGKSSVVMAGLLPALNDHHPDWVFLPCILPGDHPLEALAVMLRQHSGRGAITDYLKDLSDPKARGLILHTRGLTSKVGQRVVLFIDQFEELFTLAAKEEERRQFLDVITTAATDPRAALHVILTLRADFYDRPLAYQELARLLQAHTELVQPMSLADLREVIEEPARCENLTFEAGLVADLVFAVREQSGALPLLQFTLDQLFQRRDGLVLTRKAYDDIGGLKGALAKHAQATYDALPTSIYQDLARWLFLRLVELGSTEQETTRRRALRVELVPAQADEQPVAEEVINRFTDARLLVTGQSSSGPTVEVAHEALLREWVPLFEWLHGARLDLYTFKQLSAAVADWLRAGAQADDDALLARGNRLREFQDWARRNRAGENERRYVDASAAWRAELDRREAQQRTELDQAIQASKQQAGNAIQNQRRARIAILVAVIFGLGALLAGIFGLSAIERGRAADTQVAAAYATLTPVAADIQNGKDTLESLRLAAAANTIIDQNREGTDANGVLTMHYLVGPRTAALLALRGLKTAYTWQADAALLKALEQNNRLRVLSGHMGGVTSVAFSPDGRYALTGSWDGTARLWEASSGQTVRILSGHMYSVKSVAFSPDGRYALTGSCGVISQNLWNCIQGEARLWEVSSGQTVRTLSGHTGSVTSVAFSPDGRYALTGGCGVISQISPDCIQGEARLWEVSSGQLIRTLSGEVGIVTSVAFSPDGRYAYALTYNPDGTVRLWEVSSGQLIRTLSDHIWGVTSAAFSPDGRYALIGSCGVISQGLPDCIQGEARLWEVSSGQLIRTLSGEVGSVTSVAFSPDGRYALTGSCGVISQGLPECTQGEARLWEVGSGRLMRILSGHMYSVTSVAFSPDGRYALTGSDDSTARLWEVSNDQRVRVLSGHTSGVTSVAFSPDGRYALTSSYALNALFALPPSAKLWEVSSGQLMRTFIGHIGGVTSVAFSPDGRYALTGNSDSTAQLWEVSSGQLMRTFIGHIGGVTSVAFSPDGHYALTGGCGAFPQFTSICAQGEARLWEISSGQLVRILSGHMYSVTSVAFSPDGRYALTGSDDSTARLWEISSGQLIRVLSGHTSGVTSVAFSPDGRYALTGSWDGTAQLWELNSGQTVRMLSGHAGVVASVAFSPDGRYVLTGNGDGTAWLWEVSSGQTVRILSGHAEVVTSVAFSPDGHYALTGSQDGTARLWEIDYRAFIADACARLSQVSYDLQAWELAHYSLTDDRSTCPQYATAGTAVPTLPPTVTSLPIRLPRLAQLASPTVSVTFMPSKTYMPTFTPTYPGILFTFTPSATKTATPPTETAVLSEMPTVSIIPIGGPLPAATPTPTLASTPRGTSTLIPATVNITPIWQVGDGETITTPTPSPDTPTVTVVPGTNTAPPTGTLIPATVAITPRSKVTVEALPTFVPPTNTPTVTATYTPTATYTAVPTVTSRSRGIAQVDRNRGEVTPVGGGDLWTYVGKAGEILTIQVLADKPANQTSREERTAKGLFDPRLMVYAPDGTLMKETDDIKRGVITDEHLEGLVLPTDGHYTIEIRSSEDRTVGAYTLVIESSLTTVIVSPTASPVAK